MAQRYPFIEFTFSDEDLQDDVEEVLNSYASNIMEQYQYRTKPLKITWIEARSIVGGKYYEDLQQYSTNLKHIYNVNDMKAVNKITDSMASSTTNSAQSLFKSLRTVNDEYRKVELSEKHFYRFDHWNLVFYSAYER